jgi:transcriptional regulator of acetoin/glycerol metabolism
MAEGEEIQVSDLPAYLLVRPSLQAHPKTLEVPSEAWVRPPSASLRQDSGQDSGQAAWQGPLPVEGTFVAPALELGDGFLSLSEMEEKLIRATLQRLKGNQSAAAKKLGVSRSTLWRKMKQYMIPVE